MRERGCPKSNTCAEGVVVDAADIRVKVMATYPGRSRLTPERATRLIGAEREVSRGHSRSLDRTEDPNVTHARRSSHFDGDRRR
jgi:hypothetical protein